MVNILIFFRWILFLPAAILGGMVVSAIILMPMYYFPLLENFFLTWLFLGYASSGMFLLVGLSVAPKVNAFVKWSLLGCLMLFVIQYIIGFFLESLEFVKLLYPISVSLVIYETVNEAVNDLQSSSFWKSPKKRI
jgi:hypothetical protein